MLANSSPINDVPINDVNNPEEILVCTLVDCVPPTTATLGDALAANAFDPGVTLGDLRAHIAPENFPFTLGDIGAWSDLTIGDLVASLPDGANITLADVLVLLLGPELFGWEQLDLDSIALQRFATGGSVAGFNADFQLTSPTTTGPFPSTILVELPAGFLYQPGSSVLKQLAPVGPDMPLADPVVSGQSLTYSFSAVVGTSYRIELDALPSITLGPGAADGAVTPLGGTPAGSAPADVSVGDTFEPNPSSSPHPLAPDSFYLSYITSKDDIDFHSFTVPSAGSRVTFTLSHVPAGADYDLVVYGPSGLQLRPEIPGTPLLDGPPLEDRRRHAHARDRRATARDARRHRACRTCRCSASPPSAGRRTTPCSCSPAASRASTPSRCRASTTPPARSRTCSAPRSSPRACRRRAFHASSRTPASRACCPRCRRT